MRVAGDISGTMRIWLGQTEEGIEHAERALRLSAGVRVGSVVSGLGIAYFLTRRFEEAVPKFLLGINEDPSYPDPYRFLAASYAHMGKLDEARKVVARLREITSVVVPTADHLRVPGAAQAVPRGPPSRRVVIRAEIWRACRSASVANSAAVGDRLLSRQSGGAASSTRRPPDAVLYDHWSPQFWRCANLGNGPRFRRHAL